MSSTAQSASFSTANPHALASILDAAETRSIIASRDIFDIGGTKLWARDQPVSRTLQRKLMDRQLRQPLESCLYVEDGISARSLVQAVEALVERGGPLAALLKPYADEIVHSAGLLPLHPVAQLLLTAGQASKPASFDHAIEAMAMAGALMAAHRGNTRELRVAMLCGLLHDLGEMYIDPQYSEADADRSLDFKSYQQMVVHPHIGQLLLMQLTNYPAEVARAVAEHHERLDGSGYPHRLSRDQISPLGCMLAVTESTLSALRGEQPHLTRAGVSLRVVPGEFDLAWVGPVVRASYTQTPLQPTLSDEEREARLDRLDAALQIAVNSTSAHALAAETPQLKQALDLAQHLLLRLRTGWNASGLWSPEAVKASDAAEIEAIEEELMFRLRSIQRAAQLRAGELPEEDAVRLDLLCETLAETLR